MKFKLNTVSHVSIRVKVYFVIGTILLLFTLGFIIYHKLAARQAKIYCTIQNEELVKSVSAVMSAHSLFMERLSTDYSCFSWMCEFAKHPDLSDPKQFISPPDALGIDLFKVYNLNQECVFQQLSSKGSLEDLAFDQQFFRAVQEKKYTCFYQFSSQALYLVTASTINPSDDLKKQTPPQGYIIIGKLIDSTFLSSIEKLLTCNIHIFRNDNESNMNACNNAVLPIHSFDNQPIGKLCVSKDKTYQLIVKPLNAYINWLIIITFLVVALIIIFAYNTIVLKPLLIIQRALNNNSEKDVRSLMYKRDEFGKIARLIIRFFIQRTILTNKIDELLQTKEDLKYLNTQLSVQKEEVETSANSLLDANHSIQYQKKLITDNIYYASIVQRAALTPSIDISDVFSEHFILFKPRDVISGDFYWFKKLYGKYYIAVSDCTGHGLSGALMSMLGISFLNQIVTLPGSEDFTAAEILQQLRTFTVQSLHQQGENLEVHDGMDIAFCIIDFDTMTLEFAAAYNPIYILRPDKNTDTYNLITYKGDSMPVGIHIHNDDFTNHMIKLEKGDIVYLFTDGFIDQFGGPNDKKYLAKRLRELLLFNAHLPLEEQKQIIYSTFENWKGYNYQVDDVTMIGLKI